MAIEHKKYDADIPEGHSSQEKRNWWPEDALLRRHGFKIFARPKDGPAVWRLGSELMTVEEALERVS